jgi:tetratricopeptide (TPR) repeat protein
VTAREQLQLLGLGSETDSATDTGRDESDGGWLPAVATELVDRLDCAVLAMRFPVIDDFAVALADSFYNLVLGKGQPVPRALALSLPKVAPVPPIPGAPALSVGTPALFGSRAMELSLIPPEGGPVVFAADRQKLAGFPPQPVRFVGRVGPMTRATTALAPHSGRVGVVFHGMAGGGKTACALELAYTHRESFPLLAWHAAPPEGHDITTALSDFALALERQLPGLKLAHLVTDIATLRDHLPGLTEVVAQNRVLSVLDNIESLLTDTGQWRDERWGLLVEALIAHRGLSRLVLTSRIRPAQLDDGMVVEPVHALSLRESVLLAREWPHLRSLVDCTDLPAGLTPEKAHDLAARTLAVVQGHPKLIELANGHAGDPAALQARLDEADHTWLTQGTRLDTFLASGEAAASDRDYMAVLQGWTRATTANLPEASTVFLQFLACLEEEDRIRAVIDNNWAHLWRRLDRPGDPPDPETMVAPLVERALVAAELDPDTRKPYRYGIHPGVAETIRSTVDPEFAAAVDIEVADFWLAGLYHAQGAETGEEMGWLVRRAAQSAAPYLLHQHRWNDLSKAAEALLLRNKSSAAAAALLPMLSTATAAIPGGSNLPLELRLGGIHARALVILDPDQAETRFRELLDTAAHHQRFVDAKTLAGDLINLYLARGRLDEALALADQNIDYTRAAGRGPWTQLGDQTLRLQILYMQGHSQQVLDAGQQLRDQMANLPDPPDDHDDAFAPWSVRETLLNIMVFAARDGGRWQQALNLNNEILKSKVGRGASQVDQAETLYNSYWPLLPLDRATEARQLLQACLQIFQDDGNVGSIGKTLNALAAVEDKLGHSEPAVRLERDALRCKYLSVNPDPIATSHNNLAGYLERVGADPLQVTAHRLAAAVINYQTGSGKLTSRLASLGGLMARESDAVPVTFTELCGIVDQVPGVHLADVLDRLPSRAPDPQAAVDEVLRLAPDAAAAAGADYTAKLVDFVAAVVAAARGDSDAQDAVGPVLDEWAADSDTAGLAAAVRQIIDGGGDTAAAVEDLDPAQAAILDTIRERLEPDQEPTTSPEDL